MNGFLNGVVRAVAESFALPGPILEIGAFQVPGQEDVADLRGYFPDRPYVGLDMRSGPGVDVVGNVEALPQDDSSVGTVLALNTFEHVRRFWRGFEEIHRILRPDGALLVSCPFYFHVHAYPCDYWRFTPQALEFLLEPYPSVILGWHGPEQRPLGVWALAFREEHPPVTEEEFQRYRSLLALYAREPLGRVRRFRYLLGRWLCGSRPFMPYLERDSWETKYRNLEFRRVRMREALATVRPEGATRLTEVER